MRTYEAGEAKESERITIGIAEYDLTTNGTVLATSGLGSCVGVALYDEESGVAGLAHVMLPEADGRNEEGAKYADTGIPALLSAMESEGADRSRIVAKIAGGSEMLELTSSGGEIGRRNVEATKRMLDRHGVPLVAADVGGDHGRSLVFDPGTGDLHVRVATAEDHTI